MLKLKDKTKKDKVKPVATFEEKVSIWIGSRSSFAIHTILFLLSGFLMLNGVSADRVLLILTTLVSLEAIYLSIFIQMTVNRHTESLEDVEEDLDEIQEDIDDIQEGQDELEEDIDEIEDSDNKREREVDSRFKNIDSQLAIILDEIKKLKN
jgi:flagellar capping protein FliD